VSRTLLTIDDSDSVRRVVRACAAAAGIEVLEASDGRSAVKLLLERPVDLIVTDLHMPGIDGYGVIAAIREGLGDISTPILVLTGDEGPAMAGRARHAGVNGWLVKPFTSATLLEAITGLIG
jgi:two-component system chemotaxis response regulator CheY